MTLTTTINKTVDSGDGTSVDFEYTYKLLNELHLVVYEDGVIQTLGVDYTVDPADIGVSTGGTMTFTSAPASLAQIILLRIVPYTQLTDYVENDKFPAATHEDTLDLITMEIQQLNEQMGRAIQVDVTQTGFANLLPAPDAGKFIRWKSDLSGFENAGVPSGVVIINAFMEPLLACSDLDCVMDFTQRRDHGGIYVARSSGTSIAIAKPGLGNAGERIMIKNGALWQSREVPNLGTFSTAGWSLAANTQYWVYAYYDAGAGPTNFINLEASAAGASATDVDTGVRIKSGDATRTLVASFHTDGSGNLLDTEQNRQFISFFNRKQKQFRQLVTVDRTTTSASWVETNVADRVYWLTWQDLGGFGGPWAVQLNAVASNDTIGGITDVGIGFNGNVTIIAYTAGTSPVANDVFPVGLSGNAGHSWTTIVETTRHFLVPVIRVSAGVTAKIDGATWDLQYGGWIWG